MKARDIIPGWPRGKSTSRPHSYGPLEFRLMFSLNQLFYERELDLTPLLAEEEENLRYHERQQAMVDNFRLEKFLMRVAIIEFSRQCDVTETRA